MKAPTGKRVHGRECVALVLVLTVFGGMVTGCDGGGPRASATTDPPPSAASTSPLAVCGPRAPDGGTIEVVETGFSMVHDPGRRPLVSYGVVVENTSDHYLAVDAGIVIRLTDPDGEPVRTVVKDPPDHPRWIIQTIFPGQRLGFGEETHVDNDVIVDISVVFRTTTWTPMDQVQEVGDITAADITVDRQRSTATISFRMLTEYGIDESVASSAAINGAEAWAIFRDGDGTLVGGAGRASGWRDRDDRLMRYVGAGHVPDSAVDDLTEVYVSSHYFYHLPVFC